MVVNAKVLILDEPTSSLDAAEVAQLFDVIRRLRDQGVAILFVSHFLDQVFAISDRITVLRNGRFEGEYLRRELDRATLIAKMIGKDLETLRALGLDRHVATIVLGVVSVRPSFARSSAASAAYATAPVESGAYREIGNPWLGASANRTLRGMTVSKTRSPRYRRASAATSADSFVRASYMVSATPFRTSSGFK